MEFDHNILMIGFGGVAQCTVPILFDLIDVPYANVTVIDIEDKRSQLHDWMQKGVKFEQVKITPSNLDEKLNSFLKDGDLLIDLAWNIDACTIIQWCHDHGVLYINTSVELWDPYAGAKNKHPTERTLYWRHMKLRKMKATWKEPGPTAVVEHGANPGLITHFTKQGLVDIATKLLVDQAISGDHAREVKEALDKQEFNTLAMKMGVKVIHCSERDTQITNDPKKVDEFVNTWSVEGFREEGTTTAEMGWGTHEKELPPLAYEHEEGPKNQICLARMGINTWVVSYVPDYTIHGMVVRHGESFTISDYLTVWENGDAKYRPTVHYAYCPSDSAIASLNELRGYDYKLQEKQRILYDDIIDGADILGALIMGHPYNAWWIGTDLSIQESRRLVPHQNATTMQVAISVVAAVSWMIEHPNESLCTPENLPHEYILKISKPYLGNFISKAVDWNPIMHYKNVFSGHNDPQLDPDHIWQFKNFLITDGD